MGQTDKFVTYKKEIIVIITDQFGKELETISSHDTPAAPGSII